MITKFQISTIFFVYLIYLVSRVAPRPRSGSVSEDGNEDVNAQREACIAESGVDPYELDQETYMRLLNEGDHSLGCFLACAMKAAGTMNEDGTINDDKLKEESPKELESIQTCLEQSSEKADECETALIIVKCAT